jgi:peroxiredoxin Q/BCP
MRPSTILALAIVSGWAAAAAADTTPAAELKVGDMAPDFTLQGSDGKTHHLADFRGKKPVVLAWFPKAFTSG